MRTSYIATTSEASALHRGEQTAIIVKMKVQPNIDRMGHAVIGNINYGRTIYGEPNWDNLAQCVSPYALNEPVYVREAWAKYQGAILHAASEYGSIIDNDLVCRQSPITMPRSAARTWFKPVSCEVVRVQGITANMILSILSLNTIYNRNAVNIMSEFHRHIVPKLGQSAWDNNYYVFYYKIEKI